MMSTKNLRLMGIVCLLAAFSVFGYVRGRDMANARAFNAVHDLIVKQMTDQGTPDRIHAKETDAFIAILNDPVQYQLTWFVVFPLILVFLGIRGVVSHRSKKYLPRGIAAGV